jgi:26S proteasome non-ATPase regulatory subunit 9
MKQIEKAVEAQFAALASGEAQPEPVPSASSIPSRPAPASQTMHEGVGAPFASVNEVVDKSPASEAGLQVNDKIVEFGEANWLNHDNLRKVAAVVARFEGVSALDSSTPLMRSQRPVPVRILRGSERIQLELTPRRDWGGRGTLGCHLVPISR